MNFIVALIPVLIITAIFLSEKHVYRTHNDGIILITGASTGIGRHAAEHLAKNYNYTVLAGVRKDSDAQSILDMNLPNFKPIKVDVANHESCVQAIESIKSLMSETGLPFVALVNNAGISSKSPIEYYPTSEARSIFDINFFGVVDMTQLTLPLLRESRGRIIMISSVAGLIGRGYSGIYTASKFAIEGLSDSLRREIAHHGISVSVVEPAFVKTPIFATAKGLKEKLIESLTEEQRSVYDAFFSPEYDAKYSKIFEKADEPKVTTDAIVHSIVSSTPKTRYVVANANGIPAVITGWLEWLCSDRIMDKLMGNMV